MELKRKWQSFREFLYDRKNGTVLGRTGWKWFRVALFYVIFYALLIMMFIGMIMIVQYYAMKENYPNYYGKGSIIGNGPDLVVKAPNGVEDGDKGKTKRSAKSYTISYNMTDYTSWASVVNLTRNKLQGYEKSTSQGGDCYKNSSLTKPKATNEREDFSCKVDLSDMNEKSGFGGCGCERGLNSCNFGYDNNSGCVAIAFSKLFAWTPVSNHSGNVSCSKDKVKLTCNIEGEFKDESESALTIFPKEGISACYFPYYKYLQDYVQPIFMVRLDVGHIFKKSKFGNQTSIGVPVKCNADKYTDTKPKPSVSFTFNVAK